MDSAALKKLSYECLLELNSKDGIYASSPLENYGCIFGRDSAITIIKILKSYPQHKDPLLLSICKQTLLTLVALQGKEINIENGEEPGKFIHEFRKSAKKFNEKRKPKWYEHTDGTIRNYDSIDATPLILIALYRYYEATQDANFLLQVLPSVEKGLMWLCTFADKDNDVFIEYEFSKQRKFGGLFVQSWTDSLASLINTEGTLPTYPIAPVEVQAFVWLALKLWADFYKKGDVQKSKTFNNRASLLKKCFNESFIIKNNGLHYGVQALDGNHNPIATITGNPLLCLWATYGKKNPECILESQFIKDFVKRGFQDDLFEEDAGIRTMSTTSKTFDPKQTSYHNGSFWPILNNLIHEGLLQWDYVKEANKLKKASLTAIVHFGCPIELYIKDFNGSFLEYKSSWGKQGCRYQAWTAAALFEWMNQEPAA